MKAISIKEPWAGMIKDGRKTIETRTWRTNYRGPLLLCCSRKPFSLIAGYAFAVANLVDCRTMIREDEDQAMCKLYPNAFSWILEDVKKITPFRVDGKLRLFDVTYPK